VVAVAAWQVEAGVQEGAMLAPGEEAEAELALAPAREEEAAAEVLAPEEAV
jgi:hypothetical protein